MSSDYESEQQELNHKRDERRTKIRAEEKKTQSTNQFLETIRKYETVTELNRSMLVELIDSVYVYQAEGTGKDRRQKVEINDRFLANALVRANYNDLKNGLHETTEYLELFLKNLLLDEKNELSNRKLHINNQ